MLTLSQVILGVGDLDSASARLEESGLSVLDGGIHPGVGTANRIVPLGSSYLELLGVLDAALAWRSGYGRSLMARLEAAQGADTLVRWSLRTDDLDAVAARLRPHGQRPPRRVKMVVGLAELGELWCKRARV